MDAPATAAFPLVGTSGGAAKSTPFSPGHPSPAAQRGPTGVFRGGVGPLPPGASKATVSGPPGYWRDRRFLLPKSEAFDQLSG